MHIKETNDKRRLEPNKRFEWIWSAKAPNKIKTFLWLLYHWRPPTNHSLHHTGLNVNPKCQYSDNSKEDTTHIFFQCPNSLFFRSNILSTSHNPGITNTISTNEIDGIEQWDNMKY
ncbi:hypothetical protein R3W88_024387 [Solanum pinnatisectum]|uniref:Reverse transcriptase zinc-binding domain-containing protein n=1 Tax=Solanum pinnatisectum TaxID=50273 RepID=A0AAV9M2B7_9SOLN|nr:hypothetical protein R3W88_024387 [Solanum pinnatisectum]